MSEWNPCSIPNDSLKLMINDCKYQDIKKWRAIQSHFRGLRTPERPSFRVMKWENSLHFRPRKPLLRDFKQTICSENLLSPYKPYKESESHTFGTLGTFVRALTWIKLVKKFPLLNLYSFTLDNICKNFSTHHNGPWYSTIHTCNPLLYITASDMSSCGGLEGRLRASRNFRMI